MRAGAGVESEWERASYPVRSRLPHDLLISADAIDAFLRWSIPRGNENRRTVKAARWRAGLNSAVSFVFFGIGRRMSQTANLFPVRL
jgi:hypothetical protein